MSARLSFEARCAVMRSRLGLSGHAGRPKQRMPWPVERDPVAVEHLRYRAIEAMGGPWCTQLGGSLRQAQRIH